MGKILGAIATLLILLLVAAFAVPYLVDWNDYKGVFETEAGRLIGRRVQVKGSVNLTILPVPEMRFESISISDAKGNFGIPFAQAQSVDVTLSLAALLSGRIEAKSARVVKPAIHLGTGKDGRGNWAGLGSVDPAISFGARDVILRAVEIRDGSVDFADSGTKRTWRVTNWSGEFSAESLAGPFKFNGTAKLDGGPQDVRVATGAFNAGKLHVKASIKQQKREQTATTYIFDGDFSGFDGRLAYDGPLLVKSAFTTMDASGVKSHAIDLKATARLTAAEAKLDDIAVTIGEEVRPQVLNGSASVTWNTEPRFTAELSTHWLDADALSGGTGGANLPPLLAGTLPRLFDALPARPVSGSLKLTAEQIGFRGDTLQNVEIALAQQGGELHLSKLSAALPGDAKLTASGKMRGTGDQLRFAGKASVNGSNLGRLARWVLQTEERATPATAQNFSLDSDFSVTPARVSLENTTGQWGGSAFWGTMHYDLTGDGVMAVSLQSGQLDLSTALDSGDAGGEDAPADGNEQQAAPETPSPAPPGLTLAGFLRQVFAHKRTTLNIKVRELQLPDTVARDVAAEMEASDNLLSIAKLQFTTTDGLQLAASGKLQGLDTAPSGEIRLSLEAAKGVGLTKLASSLGFKKAANGRDTAEALAPLKATGTLTARGESSANPRMLDFRLDGVAAASPFSLAGRFEGNLTKFWDGSIDTEGWISNTKSSVLLKQLAMEPDAHHGALAAPPATDNDGQGLVSVSLKGPLNGTAAAKLSVRTPQTAASFDGKVTPGKTPWEASGSLSLKSSDATSIAGLLGPQLASFTPAGPCQLTAKLDKTGAVYAFSGLNAGFGEVTATGAVKIDAAGATPGLDVTLQTAEASLPKLAAILTGGQPRDTMGMAQAALTGTWFERPFAPAVFDGPQQSLRLKVKHLATGTGLTLNDAELDATLSGGALTLTKLRGRLLDGDLTADGKLEKAGGRYRLAGRLSLENAALARLGPQGAKPLASGAVSLDSHVLSEGFSPQGLVSALSGRGKLTFAAGTLHGLTPNAADKLMKTQAASPRKLADGELAKLLAPAIRRGDFAYTPFRAGLTIENGMLQVKRASFRGGDSVVRLALLTDLAALKGDAEFQLGLAFNQNPSKTPPVKLVFAAPLHEITASAGRLDASEAERFIAVKRMEQDMDRLEKLNQLPPAEASTVKLPEAPAPKVQKGWVAAPVPAVPDPPASGATIERQELPPLDSGSAPPPPAAKRPRAQAADPLAPVAGEEPGGFEAKVRSAIDGQSAAAPRQPRPLLPAD